MEYSERIVSINSDEIIGVVRRALGKIDPRLVNHGERVAFIAKQIYEESEDKADVDFSLLMLLCLLHDIGAYKTNEIDDMVRFETVKPFEHSLYGYLFLKYTTYLSDHAEALLYHHAKYSDTRNRRGDCYRYAQIIHLADRVDIRVHSPIADLAVFKSMADDTFNPKDVEAFYRAESRRGLCQKLLSGAYESEVLEILGQLRFRQNEILDYLKLLVYAIDFRSPFTVTHTADTTIISTETGKLMGLGERDMQMLYLGAFLHDIGKIAVPQSILEKPGRLTPEEFDIVKRHIPEGETILRGVVSDEIADIALRHHEKCNGSGYSLGLRAEEISMPQRIVAVADILSALSQRRPYKDAYPKDKVISILADMKAEGALCPRVVDTVITNYDRILANAKASHDPVHTLYNRLLREYTDRCEEFGQASAFSAAGDNAYYGAYSQTKGAE